MNFLNFYINEVIKGTKQIDIKKIKKIESIILQTIFKDKQIFTCGNGGSASVANHFLCDFNKGIKLSSKKKLKPKVISLSNNLENILAISNDIDFHQIFSFQLDNYAKKGDLLITFSCSGSSKNIIEAINYAKEKKINTISFTGFASKNIKKKSFINVDVGIKNYGVVEDIFQIIMHMISQSIRIKYMGKITGKTIL